MSGKHAEFIAWCLIGSVVVLFFMLDYFRMSTLHFNIFLAIVLLISALLVLFVVLLERTVVTEAMKSELDIKHSDNDTSQTPRVIGPSKDNH